MDSFGEPLCVTTDAGNRYRDEQKGIIMALEKNRLAVLASSAMLALSLVACSSGSTETTAADTPAEEEETVVSTEPAVETRTVYVVTEKSLHYNGGTLYYDDFKFDEKGRLIGEHEIWDGSGHAKWDNTITFEYTDEGLLAKRTEHITGDWTYVDSKHHEFEPYDLISTFDEHGNLVKVESTGEEDADGNMYQGYGPGSPSPAPEPTSDRRHCAPVPRPGRRGMSRFFPSPGQGLPFPVDLPCRKHRFLSRTCRCR